jgi:hypothetical protein
MKILTRNSGSLGFILFRPLTVAVMVALGMTLRTSAQDQSPQAQPVAPPSAPAQLSEADLETLAQPIALYPDPLLAVMLPASVYPLEIVQAARFVQDTNNIPLLDNQPWDDNVKAVAKYPTVIQKMNDDLQWTIQLGNAFADQPADLMNAIQVLRAKAQGAGTLKSTPEQIVTVTNAVVERYYDTQIVYVTNTIVEIQPANPEIVYVPVYNPTYVYYPPPGYVYSPVFVRIYWGPYVTPYRCNWWYGGVYVGGGGMVVWGGRGPYHPPYYPCPPGYRPPPYRPPPGYRPPPPGHRPPGYPPPGNRPPGNRPPGNQPPGNRPPGNQPPGNRPPGNNPPGNRPPGQGGPTTLPVNDAPWKPDPTRRQNAGTGGSRDTRESRGWNPSTPSTSPAPGTGNIGNRPSTGDVGNRPNTGNVGNRPNTGTAPGNPNTGNRPNFGNGGNNPSPGTMPSNNRPTPGNPPSAPNRPAPSNPSSGNRPAAQPSAPSNSAFNGVGNGNAARSYSNRGAASRGGGGGGARGGGGRR